METWITGSLGVAALTGLTFVAYNHPDSYSLLYKIILVVMAAAGAAVLLWNSAVELTRSRIVQSLKGEQIEEANRAVEPLRVWNSTTTIVFTLVSLYLIFLLLFPTIGIVAAAPIAAPTPESAAVPGQPN